MKRQFVLAATLGLSVAFLLVLLSALYTVTETQQVIITQFGKPVDVGEHCPDAGHRFWSRRCDPLWPISGHQGAGAGAPGEA